MSHMLKRCCVCKDYYGKIECIPENDGKVTDGYCTACGELEMNKLRAQKEMMNKINQDTYKHFADQPGPFGARQ